MIARLDRDLISSALEGFPHGKGWEHFSCEHFGRPPGIRRWTWGPTTAVRGVGGVYAFLLPAAPFSRPTTIHLHAPNKTRIPFEFTLAAIPESHLGVVYVGRTTRLAERFRGHLLPGKRKDGGQVKFGLLDAGVHQNESEALTYLHRYGKIVCYRLPGTDPI